MSVNLREQAEKDLGKTLEGEFGLPVELKDPDGNTINTSLNNNLPLVGQVMFNYTRQQPDTGQPVIINNPTVSLRITSLSRVPKAGEIWYIKIPTSPVENAPLEDFIIDADAPPEGLPSIGFIRLYLRRIEQTA